MIKIISFFFCMVPALALLLSSETAYSYPNFIGFGYTSCLNCHYNPMGGGPLTDYGRALGAAEIAAKPFYNPSVEDEELGEKSNFLGPFGRLPDWLKFSGDYRGLFLVNNIEISPTQRWIHMQAEGSVTLNLLEGDLIASGTIGYVPVPEALKTVSGGAGIPTIITREHYIGYRLFEQQLGIYVGMMQPAFGIRIDDHTAYIRFNTGLDKNDQTHGALFHFISQDNFETGVHLFLGNLFQSPSLRQKGGTLFVEFETAEETRLGFSTGFSKNDFRRRLMNAVHLRAGLGESSSLLAQIGTIREAPFTEDAQTGGVVLVQTMARLTRGLHLLMDFQYYDQILFSPGTNLIRVGPSLQYFPMQRLELRADFRGTRVTGQNTVEPDIISLRLQVHVWL